MRPWRPTLAQVGAAAFGALALVLAGLLALFHAGSRRALLEASGQLLGETSGRLTEAVELHLAEAEQAVASVEAGLAEGLFTLDQPGPAAEALAAQLVGLPGVGALALTHAVSGGYHLADRDGREAGEALLAPAGRWQVSVARGPQGLVRTVVSLGAGGWEARLTSAGATVARPAEDPTVHPTFSTPARLEQQGQALWSDLSLAEGPERRRVVTVQKALRAAGGSLGVLRVSLWSDRVDELTRVDLEPRGGLRPQVFLADEHGHLLARTAPEDRVEELEGEEVRVVPAALGPALAAALASPLLATVQPGTSGRAGLTVDGEPWLLEVRALPEGRTRGWRVGTLAPEAYFLAPLQASTREALEAAGLLALGGLGLGGLLLRAARRDLGGLLGQTERLRAFDFAPTAAPPALLRDVGQAVDSLEQAKTALRALGKYAPLDLVRQLYQARVEPALGGRVQDASVLFTDIEGFTSVSEALPLEVLAPALGRYLEAMTGAVHGEAGIIDKYTGDGLMALWNAPTPCAGHPARACAAVLACVEATEALFASPAWAGLPRWRTRFGLHRALVSVGHFGAPDRMSYTAMGDGVNLAARLESLNKQYGTLALVSADVEREARGAFDFRHLDRVAVKGKRLGVEVYELLGRRGEAPRPEAVTRYEQALHAYLERRFDDALGLLGEVPLDRPGEVLASRCRRLQATPPPADWDGVFVAQEK